MPIYEGQTLKALKFILALTTIILFMLGLYMQLNNIASVGYVKGGLKTFNGIVLLAISIVLFLCNFLLHFYIKHDNKNM